MLRPSWRRTLAASFCLLTACYAGAQQVPGGALERIEVAGRKAMPSQWFRAESQNFVVYSDAREEDVTALLDNLEKLDHLLRLYTQPMRRAEYQGAKLTLYHHRDAAGLGTLDTEVPADAVALYSSCPSGARGFGAQHESIPRLADEQLDKAPLDDTLSHAFEAYARYFLYRRTDVRVPPWFIEGFAQYFSSVRFSQRQLVLGREPQAISEYLAFIEDGERHNVAYDKLLGNDMVRARNAADAAGVQLEFDAKSWLLMHYLMASDDRRGQLSRYLELTGSGSTSAAAFERAFGIRQTDVGELAWRYRRKGLASLRIALPTLPAAQVKFHTLPRAVDEVLPVDEALKACPNPQAGRALLEKAVRLVERFPNDTLARLAVSRAQIDWGDPRDALARLDALLQEDAADADAHQLIGLARLRLAERDDGAARPAHLKDAQRHLRRALRLRPGSAEITLAVFKAEVAASEAPDEAVLRAVVAAWQTSRDIGALGRSAALSQAYAGNADEASRTLATLAQDPRDPTLARWAGQWRERLQAGVSRGDLLAEMRRPTDAVSFKAWTIDKASVLQKVKVRVGVEASQSNVRKKREFEETVRRMADHDRLGAQKPPK
jgi:hypothetical protein